MSERESEDRDRPQVPEDPKDWDIDITESEGPLLEPGADFDTGAAGGQRDRGDD
ncbi:hypothetical protein [Naasia sp. SYSU D00948]|uniref:hypothetical protein n=1 Tax=Naasia sp. SYSU D00948 TaxID=2817379 RepID=UPI001B30290E|nr:hypothetical protein [Naasia sp. SYSU D00948]